MRTACAWMTGRAGIERVVGTAIRSRPPDQVAETVRASRRFTTGFSAERFRRRRSCSTQLSGLLVAEFIQAAASERSMGPSLRHSCSTQLLE